MPGGCLGFLPSTVCMNFVIRNFEKEAKFFEVLKRSLNDFSLLLGPLYLGGWAPMTDGYVVHNHMVIVFVP